jgi:hypothetical protein
VSSSWIQVYPPKRSISYHACSAFDILRSPSSERHRSQGTLSTSPLNLHFLGHQKVPRVVRSLRLQHFRSCCRLSRFCRGSQACGVVGSCAFVFKFCMNPRFSARPSFTLWANHAMTEEIRYCTYSTGTVHTVPVLYRYNTGTGTQKLFVASSYLVHTK